MTLVVDKFRTFIPSKSKNSPSGWTSFNAPCCHHRGHRPDNKKRAGLRFDGPGFVYHCFNCGFTTGWSPGLSLGEKTKSLCKWLGASDDEIKQLIFESLKAESVDYVPDHSAKEVEFTNKNLPDNARSIIEWNVDSLSTDDAEQFLAIIRYLLDRGCNPLTQDFYWSNEPGYRDRVIIPFKWQGRIVGSTARKIRNGKPKYLSDQHPHFVFNFDRQVEGQRYLLVTEGPFDALSVNGVALLTNGVSDQQARIINSIGAEVIVIPDQDSAGLQLFDRAAELGWSVASPNWKDTIKDSAEASLVYGKLFTVVDAIETAQKGTIKISMAKKKLEQKLERTKDEKTN
jgi:hypothetical protein